MKRNVVSAIATALIMSHNASGFMKVGVSPLGNTMSLLAGRGGVAVSDILKDPQFPPQWPFKPDDFTRQDESVDTNFYAQPRLVTHIDDPSIAALTKYYKSQFFEGASVLDICSSWISHFPKDVKLGRTAGVGMNQYELSKNTQLNEYVTKDLNVDPTLPYPDNTFDFCTIVVSVDYLTRPLEVFSEMSRVLKPGGTAIISQSNRCFPTKAWKLWLNTNDAQHIYIIGSFFHYAGTYEKAEAFDVSPNPGRSDPMYIVQAKAK
jgi:hypothetical protein